MQRIVTRVSLLAGLGMCGALATSAALAQTTQPAASNASSAARRAVQNYEQLRRSFKVDSRITLAMVQGDVASHTGRAIELQGLITGVMAVQDARTMLLKVDDSTIAVTVPQNVSNPAMKSGSSVRALALVGKHPSRNEAVLTLVAVKEQAAEPLQSSRSAAQTAPTGSNGSRKLMDGDVIISPESDAVVSVPPMTSMQQIVPQPPAARPPSIAASRPGLDPDAEDSWETQKAVFKATAKRFNKKLTDAQATEIGNAIVDAGRANGMDPRFLAAIIAVESTFNIYCLSHSGAMGLGQIMPFNLKEARITNAWNPTQNIHGTARLLRGHLNSYRNRSDGTLLAVAAYNAGPGAVRRAGYKVPNGAQVQRYVWKVYYQYKAFAPDMFR